MSHFIRITCTTLVCFLLGASPVSAQVIISEVYPAPASGESEWIEIYNTSPNEIQLVGWKLRDQLSSPSDIYGFSSEVLAPYSFIAIELASAKLNNSADGVTLLNSQGEPIAVMSYTSSESSKSWQRTTLETSNYAIAAPSKGSNSSEYPLNAVPQPTPTPAPTPEITPAPTTVPAPTSTLQPSATPSPGPSTTPEPTSTLAPTPSPTPIPTSSPTPSPSTSPSPSPTPTPSITTSSLQISEIMACPSSGTEWLELYNAASESLSFQNWKVVDESGNYKVISGTVPAQSWEIFSWSGSLLNNSGDSLTLTTSSNQVLFSLEYGSCTTGSSLVFNNTSWVPAEATARAENKLTSLQDTTTTTNLQAQVTKTAATLMTDSLKLSASSSARISKPSVLGSQVQESVHKFFQLPDIQSFTSPKDTASPSAVFVAHTRQPPKKILLGAILSGIVTFSSSFGILYGKKIIETFTTLG